MPMFSVAMREKIHWIPKEKKPYLVMDNAGGHGTDNETNQYTQIYEEKTYRSFGK